mgnify:CR=1 FL=1
MIAPRVVSAYGDLDLQTLNMNEIKNRCRCVGVCKAVFSLHNKYLFLFSLFSIATHQRQQKGRG